MGSFMARGFRSNLPAVVQEQLIEAYKSGTTYAVMREQFQMSHGTLANHIRRFYNLGLVEYRGRPKWLRDGYIIPPKPVTVPLAAPVVALAPAQHPAIREPSFIRPPTLAQLMGRR